MIQSVASAEELQQIPVSTPKRTGLGLLATTGTLTILGYVCYFFLMQSHGLWQSPTLVQDRWKQIFYPISNLFPRWWVRPPADSPVRLVAAGLYLLLLFGLFAVYLIAVRRAFHSEVFGVTNARRALLRIVLVTVAALLVLLVVPAALSTDLFSYAWYGRIFTVFGDNPFTHVPADYTWHDTGHWLQWVFWRETPSAYGPVWVLLAGIVASIAQALGGDIVNHILGHKILADLAHLVNILLVWKVAGLVIASYWRRPAALPAGVTDQDWRAGAQVGATLAYAWNPLIMIEFGANGHNDVLMLTALLFALWLHLSGRWRFALVALGVAIQIKFSIALFLPGYLWLLFWQAAPGGTFNAFARRLWTVAQAAIILLATIALFYTPFWEGPATLKPLTTGPFAEMFVNSFGYVIRFKLPEGVSQLAHALRWQPADMWTATAISDRLDWPARWGPMLIFLVIFGMQTWRARTFPRMVVAWGWIAFVYVTVGAVWFWPWYVSWLVVIAALVGPGRLFNATQILSLSSMVLYATYWRGDHTFVEWAGYRPLLMLGPPLIYAIVAWWRDTHRKATTVQPETAEIADQSRTRTTSGHLLPAQVMAEAQEPQ